jgi:hypothetical protein
VLKTPAPGRYSTLSMRRERGMYVCQVAISLLAGSELRRILLIRTSENADNAKFAETTI